MHKVSASSTESRVPKVVVQRQVRQGGRVRTANSLVPAHQAGRRAHRPCIYHQSFRSVPTGLFAGTSARYTGRIESGAFHRSNCGGVIRIQLRLTDAAQLTPAWTWFDRLSFRSAGGSSHVTTAYSDSLAFMQNAYDDQELRSILPLMNATQNWGHTAQLSAGVHVFYLPLTLGWMQNLYMDDLQGDVLVDFYPQAGGITMDATHAGRVQCEGMSILMASDCVTQEDKALTKGLHASNIMSKIFVEPLRIEHNSIQLTAGQERQLALDNVTGNVAFFTVCCRNAGATNESNGLWNYISLANAKIDLKSAAGRSEYGEGQPVDEDYLRHFVWARSVGNNFAQHSACVVIPCCDSIRAALNGVRSGGFRTYRGDRDTISITPGSGFASGTYAVIVYAYLFKQLHKRDGVLTVENA